jgi:ABC-type transport system involved in multi-copper enzyme maturation permease subunit
MATIREKGYYHWDGQLAESRFPWWPITRTGIRLAFKKRGFRFLFAGALLPAVGFLAAIYASERLEDFRFMVRGSDRLIKVDPGFFNTFLTNGAILFLLIMVLVFGCAGLIADDLKHNSLQIYFSRPLQKKDYLLGKMGVVFFFILVLTLIPGLLLFIFKLVFAGSFRFFLDYPWLLPEIAAYSLVLTVFFAFYTLLLSALSKNSRYVMILIFTVYLFSHILYGILHSVFRTPYMALFSVAAILRQAGAFIFGQKLPHAVPAGWSFLVLAAVCGLSVLVLKKKIRGVEVIR